MASNPNFASVEHMQAFHRMTAELEIITELQTELMHATPSERGPLEKQIRESADAMRQMVTTLELRAPAR